MRRDFHELQQFQEPASTTAMKAFLEITRLSWQKQPPAVQKLRLLKSYFEMVSKYIFLYFFNTVFSVYLFSPLNSVISKVLYGQPGHTIANVQMTILELCHTKDPMVLGVREQHYVKLFNAWHKGMNRNKGG